MTAITLPRTRTEASVSDVSTRLYPHDYLPYKLFDTDGTYAYGLSDAGTALIGYRLDSSYNATALGTIQGISGQGASSSISGFICLAGVLFVQMDDTTTGAGKRYLARSTDLGATWTPCVLTDSTADVYSNGQIGMRGATHSSAVSILGTRGMCSATIDGGTVLFFGEYNTNGSRVAGGANDWVRIWKSTNLGANWTVAMEWNTSGHQVRHCHFIKQDLFYPQYIWVGNGDNPGVAGVEGGGGFIRWDVTVAPTWTNNWDYSTNVGTPAGFKASSSYVGALQNRQMCTDLIFTQDYIYNPADWGNNLTGAADIGIWRFDRDMTVYQNVDRSNAQLNLHSQYWGMQTTGGTLISTEIKDGTDDHNIYVYTSANGKTWHRSGVILQDAMGSTTTFTADASTDVLAPATALTGTYQRVQFTTATTLPAGLSLLTDHWITVANYKVSTSYANAVAGVYVNITDAGTGVHNILYGETAGGVAGMFEWNGKVYMSFSKPALKKAADSICTIVLDPVGKFEDYGPEPEVLSPVFWVSNSGVNSGADPTGISLYGYSSRYPWLTPAYAFAGSRLGRGARVIMAAGTYTGTGVKDIDPTFKVTDLPDSGFYTTVEGAGKDLTIIQVDSAAAYLFNHKDTAFISRVSDLTAYPTRVGAGHLTYASALTGTAEYRRCKLGNTSASYTPINVVYAQTGKIKLTQCEVYANDGTNCLITAGAGSGSIEVNSSLVSGGLYGIYHGSTSGTVTGANNTIVGYKTAGVGNASTVNNIPQLRNTLLYSTHASNTYSYIDNRSAGSSYASVPFDFCYANKTTWITGGVTGAAWTAGVNNVAVTATPSPFTGATDHTVPASSGAYRKGKYTFAATLLGVKQTSDYRPNIGAY